MQLDHLHLPNFPVNDRTIITNSCFWFKLVIVLYKAKPLTIINNTASNHYNFLIHSIPTAIIADGTISYKNDDNNNNNNILCSFTRRANREIKQSIGHTIIATQMQHLAVITRYNCSFESTIIN